MNTDEKRLKPPVGDDPTTSSLQTGCSGSHAAQDSGNGGKVTAPAAETLPSDANSVAKVLCGSGRPPAAIASLPGLSRHDFPCRTIGYVYFLTLGETVVYVGQTIHLATRFNSHRADKDFDGAWYIECPRTELDRIEREWIDRLRPVLNRAGVARVGPRPAPVAPYNAIPVGTGEARLLAHHKKPRRYYSFTDRRDVQSRLMRHGMLHRRGKGRLALTTIGKLSVRWAEAKYPGIFDDRDFKAGRRLLREFEGLPSELLPHVPADGVKVALTATHIVTVKKMEATLA